MFRSSPEGSSLVGYSFGAIIPASKDKSLEFNEDEVIKPKNN